MATPGRTPRSDWIGYLLRISAARVASAFNSAFAELGLDIRSYHVLYLASLSDRPFNQQAVAAMLDVNQNVIGEIVKDLSERKLIKQVPNHVNRREKFLALTPQGKDCLDKATAIGEGVQANLLARLNPEEQAEFVRLLKKFAGEWFMGPR